MNTNAFYSIEKVATMKSCYDPADYMWYLTLQNPTDWLWHILKIQGNLAWDITKGNPNLKVAVIDAGVDPTHPDLIGKLDPPYDFYSNSPFNVHWHGTSVCTILAGETVDQGQTPNGQIASIGYNTRIMYSSYSLPACVYASTVMGAQIISISWYQTCSPTPSQLLAENEINDNGTTIFKAAGNGSIHCSGNRLYPFSGFEDTRTIVVTSSDKDDNHQNINPGGGTNSHYSEVDICAPGYCLMGGTTVASNPTWPYYGCWGGTSQSTPIAAGVGALMLSVSSCLINSSIQDIIKSTADPVTDATNYPGMVGAGRINAYQSVLAAQSMYSSSIDLFMKDIPHDFGVEPNPDNGPMWISDDIWVRKINDGGTEHQNPEYWINPAMDNYVYIKVRNKSCTDFVSTPSDLLHVHWAKAASSLMWPDNWYASFGVTCGGGPPMGDEIPSSPQQIPNIPAGGEAILVFPWHVPDPALYSGCNPEPWHFCLLSRIDSPQDLMAFPEVASVYDNARNNNNIAWKNVTIVDDLPGIAHNEDCYRDRQVGGVIAVGNPFLTDDNYKLEFKVDNRNRGIPVFEQAQIKLTLDNLSWEKWAQGGFQAENVRVKREDCRQLVITGSPAYLKNLTYTANERSTMNVSFNFITDKIDATPEFDYHVIQRTTNDDKIIGGELYRIRKPQRSHFSPDAGGDKTISEGTSTTLSASVIGENAYYNWYDPEGNLIYSGNYFTVSPEITTKYKLEVIAVSDGFSSFDSLTVKIKDCEIESITPNPSSTQITVQYKAQNVTSGYLVITHASGSPNDNYILNLNQNMKVINVANYASGNYNLILVCDGEVKDQKLLSIVH